MMIDASHFVYEDTEESIKTSKKKEKKSFKTDEDIIEYMIQQQNKIK